METPRMDKAIINGNTRGKNLVQSAEELPHLAGLLFGLALLLAVVSYWPALEYGFIYDDTQQIVENPALRSWSYLGQYFAANVWEGVFPGRGGDYYRPLFLMWLRLNYILFKVAPRGWHLTSLLAHMVATGMFFLVVRQWTGDGVVAGWGALLFSVHPIHIEAVVWVSAVPEVLFTVAGLGAIYSYVRWRREQRRVLLLVAVMLYGMALFTKETAIVVWPMIVACDWWLERDRYSGVRPAGVLATVKMQVPFAVVTAVYIGQRLHALRGLVVGQATATVGEVLRSVPSLVWFYVRKFVVPAGLSPIYSDSRVVSMASPQFYLPLIAVCVVGVGLFLWGCKSRAAAFSGLLLALSVLPPLIGVWVFRRHDLAHDRYLYLPSAGGCMLLALALRAATRRGKPPAAMKVRWLSHLTIAAAVIVLVCAVRAQEPPYRNNLALFTRAVQISPDNTMAWGLLGEEFMTLGRYPEGIAAFQRAHTSEPDEFLTNYRLGAAYYLVQDMASAEGFFQRAVNSYREREVVSLDYALYRLGLSQYAQGKMPLAEATLRRAAELDPKTPGYHLALGAAMKYQGKLPEARKQLELELKLGANPEASRILGEVDGGLNASAPR
jgi:tetratricopeptide (TPR) repeat protein